MSTYPEFALKEELLLPQAKQEWQVLKFYPAEGKESERKPSCAYVVSLTDTYPVVARMAAAAIGVPVSTAYVLNTFCLCVEYFESLLWVAEFISSYCFLFLHGRELFGYEKNQDQA